MMKHVLPRSSQQYAVSSKSWFVMEKKAAGFQDDELSRIGAGLRHRHVVLPAVWIQSKGLRFVFDQVKETTKLYQLVAKSSCAGLS